MAQVRGNTTVEFNLKGFLKKRGLTYEQFGEKFEPVLTRGSVSRMNSANGITFNRLAQIVEALEMTDEELKELFVIYKKG
jgi:DNA-binding Xre family transcriptional regulator